MSIEICKQKVNITSATKSATLNFDQKVQQVVVGMSYFNLGYPASGSKEDHQVQRFSIELDYTQPNGSSNEVPVTVNAILKDSSGHSLQGGSIDLVGIAITGDSSDDVDLVPVSNWIRDGRQKSVSLDSKPVGTPNVFLGGFNLEFGKHGISRDGDNEIHQVLAGASISPADKDIRQKNETKEGTQLGSYSVNVEGTADMCDAAGHDASTKEIEACVVAPLSTDSGIEIHETGQKQTDDSFKIKFSAPISDAAVLIKSYNITYPQGQDHEIENIISGCTGWNVIDNNEVKLSNAMSRMYDKNAHGQDNKHSNVSLIVVGKLA